MTQLYRLCPDSTHSFESAWNTLEESGIEILFGSEEEGQVELIAHLPSPDYLSHFEWITSCEPYTLPQIDWDHQWQSHGHNFQDGYVNIDIDSSLGTCQKLRLEPGSGFGDLSHPTTRLMLDLLKKHLNHQTVIDIGCGSGVLTLTAAMMGAKTSYGIDIDSQAIDHSRQNARLNDLDMHTHFFLAEDFIWHPQSEPILILMNMIRTEQLVAWGSHPSFHDQPAEIITSGIRIEEKELYLDQASAWKWTLINEKEEEGWLAFHFARYP